MNDIFTEGDLKNADGSNVTWENWALPQYPNGKTRENCMIAYYNYELGWDDLACTGKYNSIIEIHADQLTNECFEGTVIFLS